MMRKPKFDIDQVGYMWFWRLYASNGTLMAECPEDGYETKAQAIKACEWLMDNIERARILVDGKEVA